MKKVIFSLKPAWAEKILSGEKKVGLRDGMFGIDSAGAGNRPGG